MRIFSLISLFTLLLFSCSDSGKKDTIIASWKISRFEVTIADKNAPPIDFLLFSSFQGGYFRFYNDHTLIVWHQKLGYHLNHWEYSVKNGYYLLTGPTFEEGFALKQISREGTEAKFRVIDAQNREEPIILHLKAVPMYEFEETDLLKPSENVWRIKPTQPENPEQLKRRVQAMVNYSVSYFRSVNEKEQAYFEPALLQSPFRFYQRGIGVAPKDELPKQ